MKTLIVEDDFTSRKMMQMLLAKYGECDIAINGQEAVAAFSAGANAAAKYDLICLDIVMPEMDGHAVLKEIRKQEAERGIHGLDGVKVIMTTAMHDSRNVLSAFNEQCEAYLLKPIVKESLLRELKKLGLIA